MMRSLSLFLCAMFLCGNAVADVSQVDLMRAVLGEAEACTASEMTQIANVTLNRGSLKGIYGHKAISLRSGAFWRGSRRISTTTTQKAEKCVLEAISKRSDRVSTHWLSNWDLKHCRPSLIKWKNSMRVTLRTKNFTFYAE